MCGIIGYVGGRPCRELILTGLERLEYRGYDSAGFALLDGIGRHRRGGARGGQPLRSCATPPARTAASSATAGLGHTRWATHGRVTTGQRAPARQRRRLGARRDERHHRELPRAALRAPGPGRRLRLGHRHRGHPAADRPRVPRRPGGGRARGAAAPGRPLRLRRRARGRARAAWWPPAASARWCSASATASASSPRPSRPSCARPATSMLIEDDEVVVIEAGSHTVWQRRPRSLPPRAPRAGRLGRGRRREGRLRDLHAQGDPRAAVRPLGHDRRPPAPRRLGGARRPRPRRRRPGARRAHPHRGLRHLVPRRPRRPVPDRGLGARAGARRGRLRVPLPHLPRRPRRPGASASPRAARRPTRWPRCAWPASAAPTSWPSPTSWARRPPATPTACSTRAPASRSASPPPRPTPPR